MYPPLSDDEKALLRKTRVRRVTAENDIAARLARQSRRTCALVALHCACWPPFRASVGDGRAQEEMEKQQKDAACAFAAWLTNPNAEIGKPPADLLARKESYRLRGVFACCTDPQPARAAARSVMSSVEGLGASMWSIHCLVGAAANQADPTLNSALCALDYYDDAYQVVAYYTGQLTAAEGERIRNGSSLASIVPEVPERPVVRTIHLAPHVLSWLRESPERLLELGPGEFEELVAERLAAMGMEVLLLGKPSEPDGGIDIIARPRRGFPFLLATQVKHHGAWERKTGRPEVDQFLGALIERRFTMGMIVTNTHFTDEALWRAGQHRQLLRLRDYGDVSRWLYDGLNCPEEWREIPTEVEVGPDVWVPTHVTCPPYVCPPDAAVHRVSREHRKGDSTRP